MGQSITSLTSNIDFRVCAALLLLVNVASKCGDALAPSLLHTWPLLLIALNANDLHLALIAAGAGGAGGGGGGGGEREEEGGARATATASVVHVSLVHSFVNVWS